MNSYCTHCSRNLGYNSTRQLCQKTYCDTSFEDDIETIRINLIDKYYDEIKYYKKILNNYINKFKSNNNNKYMKFIRYYDKKLYHTYKKITRIY